MLQELDQSGWHAPQGYQDFDRGAAKKYVLNPNGLIAD